MAPLTSAPSAAKTNPGKRHHRTATPEQRQIRAIFKAPVYTLGIDPQADRGLLSDFFDAIQTWANTCTISIRTLSPPQIQHLLAHPAITHCLGSSPHLASLVLERDMLPTLVAAIISRVVVKDTLSPCALQLSGHEHGDVTAQLALLWDQLAPEDNEDRAALLHAQKQIYTSFKSSLPTLSAIEVTSSKTSSSKHTASIFACAWRARGGSLGSLSLARDSTVG